MMPIPSGMTLVKTSGETVRLSMGMRESQPFLASGGRMCVYWFFTSVNSWGTATCAYGSVSAHTYEATTYLAFVDG
jgi:hypothetical protein